MLNEPKELHDLLHRTASTPIWKSEVGDYAEFVDENDTQGPVAIRRANGVLLAILPLDVWDALPGHSRRRLRASHMNTDLSQEFLTFRESKMWVACWRRYDIVAQGKTEKQAIERLIRQIAYTAVWNASEGKRPFQGVPKPSAKLLERWERSHNETHRMQMN